MCVERCCCKCVRSDGGVCDIAGEIGCGYTCDKFEPIDKTDNKDGVWHSTIRMLTKGDRL